MGRKRLRLAGMVGVAGLSAGCVDTAEPPPAPPSPMALYQQAISDAAVKQPSDLEASLTPITTKEVLVSTWSYDLDSRSTAKGIRTLGEDVWVTVAPDLQRRCQEMAGEDQFLRLQQLLGLPPEDATDRKIFTFLVRSADIFRPCADPRITTTSCTLDVPDAQPAGPTTDAHLRFLLRQILSSYRVGFDRFGYPFTALGYTYDWKPDSETHHIGLSEYVVRRGAVVRDVKEIDTAEYCAKPEDTAPSDHQTP
jgi:hypothetical protein